MTRERRKPLICETKQICNTSHIFDVRLGPFPFLRPLHKAHTHRDFTQKDTIARESKQFSFYLSSRWALHSKLVCSKAFYPISTLQHAFKIFQYSERDQMEKGKFQSLAFSLSLRLEFVEGNSWDWNNWYRVRALWDTLLS